MFIGGYLLRFLGAIIIYLYELVVALIFKRKIPTFREIWSAPYGKNFYSSVTDELLQKGIGFIFLMLIFYLMVRFS
jgi:hypothetical protein